MSQKLDVLSKYPDAVELGELYRQAGFDLYLVGGLVRDELRNAPGEFTDFDMTTNATPAQSEQILSAWGEHIWDIGKEYGTISARKNGAVYEVTTYRAEVYVADSRKPTVEFGTDLKADLIRRDFTINAMAVCLNAENFGQLIDPFDGLYDLEDGIIRTPLDPDITFSDDPLRMLRCVRFATQLRFFIEDETFDALTMWFVIEHFEDLHAVLLKVSESVKKGGVFAFSTPSASGLSARFAKKSFLKKE